MRRGVAGLVLALLAVGSAVAAPASARPSGEGAASRVRTLAAWPRADLVTNDLVRLHGEGWGNRQHLEAHQCAAGATDDDRCIPLGRFVGGRYGGFRRSFPVQSVLSTPTGPVDCRVEACEVLVTQQPRGTFSGTRRVAVTFDPEGPAPGPTGQVHPSADLVDGAIVVVRGAGFAPYDYLVILQCTAHPRSYADCDAEAGDDTGTNDRGRFTRTLSAWMTIQTPRSGPVDCRVTACSFFVQRYRPRLGRGAEVPIAFDTEAEPMARQITVSPTTGLEDGDRVLVEGTGFHPFSWVDVDMCVAGATSWADCDHQNTSWNWPIGPARPIPADWEGLPEGFRGRMPVRDHLVLDDRRVNCRRTACFLVFNAFHDEEAYDQLDPPFDPYVVVPLTFAAN